MTEREPSVPDVSDDALVRLFTVMTIGFAVPLLLLLVLGVGFLVPGGSVRTTGAIVGTALGLVSWFGSRWATGRAAANAARDHRAQRRTADGREQGAAGVARTVAFIGIAVAEVPGLIGLTLAMRLGSDTGSFVVAIPVAVAAIVLNASGPSAIRRHLARVRA